MQALHKRFLQGDLLDERIMEVLPVGIAFLPASQRAQTAESRAAWAAYIATKAGATHAKWRARRDADPSAVVTREDGKVIVQPLLDPARAEPWLSGPRLARHWAGLSNGDPDKWEELRFFITAAPQHPAFHEAVRLIAIDQSRPGGPLSADACSQASAYWKPCNPRVLGVPPGKESATSGFTWPCSRFSSSVEIRPWGRTRKDRNRDAASWPTSCI